MSDGDVVCTVVDLDEGNNVGFHKEGSVGFNKGFMEIKTVHLGVGFLGG